MEKHLVLCLLKSEEDVETINEIKSDFIIILIYLNPNVYFLLVFQKRRLRLLE